MKLSTLLIIFSVGIILYSSYGLRANYNRFKIISNYSTTTFINGIAGIVVGVLLLILYFLGYIDVE